MAKRNRARTASVPSYRPPTQRQEIKSDSEMMARDIMRNDPKIKAQERKLARGIERDAIRRMNRRPRT